MTSDGIMTISGLADAANVNTETIRYYERRGLIRQPRKPEQGWRRYDEQVLMDAVMAATGRLTAVVFLGAALAGCSNEARANAMPIQRQQEATQAPDAPTATTIAAGQVTIPIEGMACDSCAEHLQQQLARIDGVLEAAVDFDKKEARVKFDPTKVAINRLVAEINKAFTAGEPHKGGEG